MKGRFVGNEKRYRCGDEGLESDFVGWLLHWGCGLAVLVEQNIPRSTPFSCAWPSTKVDSSVLLIKSSL